MKIVVHFALLCSAVLAPVVATAHPHVRRPVVQTQTQIQAGRAHTTYSRVGTGPHFAAAHPTGLVPLSGTAFHAGPKRTIGLASVGGSPTRTTFLSLSGTSMHHKP